MTPTIPQSNDLTRTIARVRAMLREAEQATLPCGIRPPNHQAARDKLLTAARELQGAL